MASQEIRFYDKKSPYYEFSNFYEAPFECDGHRWRTSEHYFQTMKYQHEPQYFEWMKLCDSPLKVFAMGRHKPLTHYHARLVIHKKLLQKPVNEAIAETPNITLRPDWDAVKEAVMRKALRAKFAAHPKLREMLMETGDALLIEASPRDDYWGCGKHGNGKNRLGVLLMELRESVRLGA